MRALAITLTTLLAGYAAAATPGPPNPTAPPNVGGGTSINLAQLDARASALAALLAAQQKEIDTLRNSRAVTGAAASRTPAGTLIEAVAAFDRAVGEVSTQVNRLAPEVKNVAKAADDLNSNADKALAPRSFMVRGSADNCASGVPTVKVSLSSPGASKNCTTPDLKTAPDGGTQCSIQVLPGQTVNITLDESTGFKGKMWDGITRALTLGPPGRVWAICSPGATCSVANAHKVAAGVDLTVQVPYTRIEKSTPDNNWSLAVFDATGAQLDKCEDGNISTAVPLPVKVQARHFTSAMGNPTHVFAQWSQGPCAGSTNPVCLLNSLAAGQIVKMKAEWKAVR